MRSTRPVEPSVDEPARRSVVPPRAARSLWLSAVWTGAGTAAVAAVIGIAAVAVCWLPASGPSGNAGSAIRAGLLTFLASVHGGITVGGLDSDFVPLGMTLLVGGLAWRAGTGLADAAADLGETMPGRLIGAAALQAGSFALACAVLGRLATLGTSSVPTAGVVLAAFALFLVVGGAAVARHSIVGTDVLAVLPSWVPRAGRAALAVTFVYLAAGCLLVVASLVTHHGRVETLSSQLGGGISGLPVVLLGVLAAPNAAIAGSSYLAGPGFAVGTGNGVSLTTGGHGVLPAFPILGAVPSGPAGTATWLLAALTFVLAGGCASALIAGQQPGWTARIADLARAAGLAALIAAVLGWQGGGAIGDGHLAAVGVSPWQSGLAMALVTFVGGALGLGVLAARDALRGRQTPVARLQALADRATEVADRLDERIEATHSVVEVPEPDAPRGIVRSTLSSVAKAVTTTEDERAS